MGIEAVINGLVEARTLVGRKCEYLLLSNFMYYKLKESVGADMNVVVKEEIMVYKGLKIIELDRDDLYIDIG